MDMNEEKEVKKSSAVEQAQAMIQQQMAQKPGQYQSPWQTQLNDTMGKILNREKFSYDLNGDALMKQYKDQFTQQGKMAMMDTMGQAAAMTGGYGNSYAQNAGQQAYQGYLTQMNDKIPELYQLALSKYQMEGDDLKDQFSLLGAMEEQDYGRYRDQVSDYNAELDRLVDRFDTERAYEYQVGRDAVADKQWQAEFDEALRQFNFKNKLGEFAEQQTSGSGGGGNPSQLPAGYDNWDAYWDEVYRRRYEAEQAAKKNAGSAKNTVAMLK